MSRLERRWSELGDPRPPHRPPLEHLLSLPEDAVPEREREAGRQVVDCYYRLAWLALGALVGFVAAILWRRLFGLFDKLRE